MPGRFLSRLLLAAMLLFVWAASASATVRYVGPGGSDESAGTDTALPLATLARANTLATDGDTIRILGDLSGEGNRNIIFTQSNLTIEGYGDTVSDADPDTWPVIDAGDASYGMQMHGSVGGMLRRLAFVGGTYSLAFGDANGVTVDHCKAGRYGADTNNGIGLLDSRSCTISSCFLVNCNSGMRIEDSVDNEDADNLLNNIIANGCLFSSLHVRRADGLVIRNSSFAVDIEGAINVYIEESKNVDMIGVTVSGGDNSVEINNGCRLISIIESDISGADYYGIYVDGSFGVCIVDSDIHDNAIGVIDRYVPCTLLAGNRMTDNTSAGLQVLGAFGSVGYAFLNTFSGNAADLVSGNGLDGVVSSPVRMQYNAGWRAVKAVLGNHYADCRPRTPTATASPTARG